MSFTKYERDGKVAVLYSPGYGAGWSTWEDEYANELAFDSEIVEAVLNEDYELAASIAEKKYGAYTEGASNLEIEWIPKGTAFLIEEYDGRESIYYVDSIVPFIA